MIKATVIRGNGPLVEVVMNGIVNEEIKKMREHDEFVTARRNDMLKDRLNKIEKKIVKRNARRIREFFSIKWAQFWGIGEALGLWAFDKE